MPKPTDVRIVATRLYFLPLEMRVPLKFGAETVTSVTCARACVTVEDGKGRRAEGWGETPLSVQWVWPSRQPYVERHEKLKEFCRVLARELANFQGCGHAFEIGADFQERELERLLQQFNATNEGTSSTSLHFSDARSSFQEEPMPLLAALVCLSVFDIASHDAFGQLHQRPVYSTYSSDF